MSDAPTPEFVAPVAPEVTKPSEPTPTPESPPEPSPEPDYKDKFEAQQKVNRDLERKYKDAAGAKERLAELEARIAKYEGKEAEYIATQEAQRLKDEAVAAANERILKAEVRAAAKGVLADAADAFKFLDLSEFEVGSDGDVDADAITSALNDLVASKPYLAAQSSRKFQGTADGGARNDATRPTQLSEQDVKRLAAEGRHDEIVKAKAEGRLTDYLAS